MPGTTQENLLASGTMLKIIRRRGRCRRSTVARDDSGNLLAPGAMQEILVPGTMKEIFWLQRQWLQRRRTKAFGAMDNTVNVLASGMMQKNF